MKTFKNSIGMEFVLLPSSAFRMGLRGQAEPVHTVKLSAFWMGKFEVTNAQLERFKPRKRPVESMSDNQPATRLLWEDTVHFCQWMSKKEGKRYRLPTEAEWEYAARGGLDQKTFPWGDDIEWVGRATFGVSKTTLVGSYPPNGFGLYDVTGNVAEFVSDWYDENYYRHSPSLNPKGPAAPPLVKGKPAPFHVIRGGFFGLLQEQCGARDLWSSEIKPDPAQFNDSSQADGTGFRVVMEQSV